MFSQFPLWFPGSGVVLDLSIPDICLERWDLWQRGRVIIAHNFKSESPGFGPRIYEADTIET